VYKVKRLGRDAAKLTALAHHLLAHGLVLEMLAGLLAGMYDLSGHGKLLFASSRRWRRASGRTSASRPWKDSPPLNARASTAVGRPSAPR
jgi:hypothetical protein